MNTTLPAYTLRSGVVLPALCVGTNRMNEKLLDEIVPAAIRSGIRFFDSAQAYGNERQVGEALRKAMALFGLVRQDVFVTTKVNNNRQLSRDMRHELERSLSALHLDYIDVWLLHWPYPGYFTDNYKQMAGLLESGQVKSIGLANPRIRHMQELYDTTGLYPQIIQIEHHPFRQVPEIVEYCRVHKIQIEAYSPLCFMIDRLKNNRILKTLAGKYCKSVGQIVLRWHLQHGILPVFRSEKPSRFAENTDIFDFSLSNEDMAAIASMDEDYKFIPESLHCPGY